MQIDFHGDPACPWTWLTWRWLTDAADRRDVDVRWRPFSLQRKNGENTPAFLVEKVAAGHRSLRVLEAVRDRHGEVAVRRLYTELGRLIHHEDDGTLERLDKALQAAGADADLATAAHDERYDARIAEAMDGALALAGDDVGSPILVLDGEVGFMGPVVNPTPRGEDAARLLDGVLAMMRTPGFHELKRSARGDLDLGQPPPA